VPGEICVDWSAGAAADAAFAIAASTKATRTVFNRIERENIGNLLPNARKNGSTEPTSRPIADCSNVRRTSSHNSDARHVFSPFGTALHKKPNLTTDNTDNTDLHGSRKFNIGTFLSL
jgi:hypothetical protein